ncbi:efflux RND transporter periplasmic adaptor subunit [Pirellulaceae bacterium SH501]
MQRLLVEIGTALDSSESQDVLSLARLMTDRIGVTLPQLIVVLWSIQGDTVNAAHEYGLSRYAEDGRVYVGPEHLNQIRDCHRSNLHIASQFSVSLTRTPLESYLFPVSSPHEGWVLELLVDKDREGTVDKWIVSFGEELAKLLRQAEEARRSTSPNASPIRIVSDLNELIDRNGIGKWDQFLSLLYEQVDSKKVAAVVATDGRGLIGCDRLSVLLFRGNRTIPLAISHVETIQRRSGLVKALRKLASSARMRTRSFVVQGEGVECPIDLLDDYANFVAESRSQSLAIFPLIPSDALDSLRHTLSHRKPKSRASLGLLVVEQFTSSEDFKKQLIRTESLLPHVSNAMKNAVEYESVLFLPFWKWIGYRIRWLLGYPKLAIASVAMVLLAFCLVLAMVPATYRVHADGVAMPAIQHEVFAKVDGIVKQIFVTSGQRIKKGDLLLRLDNKELEIELVEAKNKAVELGAKVASLGVRLEASRQKGDLETELSTEGERAAALVELEGTKQRIALLEDRLTRLEIKSSYDGVVATFQPSEFLEGRPVKQGDLLLEVMDADGPWRLELDISEYRMGHVLKSLRNHQVLDVRYVAMTEVSSPKFGKLHEIATRADYDSVKGAYVRAYADIKRDDVPNQRIGAEVSAKIRCPQYSLFYCIFGDVVEFLQRNLWW